MELRSLKMKVFVVGCILMFYFVHSLITHRKGCYIDLQTLNERYLPIILKNKTAMITPRFGRVYLQSRENIILICPGPKNYLTATQLNVTHARCIQGNVLRITEDDFNFDQLECRLILSGTVSPTKRKCGDNRGYIYKIGYSISARRFIWVIKACYDPDSAVTFYTEHLLQGEDIRYASKSSYRPVFRADGVADSVSVGYKRQVQKSTLNELLKSGLRGDEYINQTSFLARGHLSPDADFILAATQFTTYTYINVSPQWQTVNTGNWLRIERMVRKIADSLRETLVIYTGTFDVLTLPDTANNPVKIYLVAGGVLPVPKYFWKIIYSRKSREAIVLIMLNNPFLNKINEEDLLCKNICDEVGWSSKFWVDYRRGYVICCDYGEFVARVKTAPKLEVTGTLQDLNTGISNAVLPMIS